MFVSIGRVGAVSESSPNLSSCTARGVRGDPLRSVSRGPLPLLVLREGRPSWWSCPGPSLRVGLPQLSLRGVLPRPTALSCSAPIPARRRGAGASFRRTSFFQFPPPSAGSTPCMQWTTERSAEAGAGSLRWVTSPRSKRPSPRPQARSDVPPARVFFPLFTGPPVAAEQTGGTGTSLPLETTTPLGHMAGRQDWWVLFCVTSTTVCARRCGCQCGLLDRGGREGGGVATEPEEGGGGRGDSRGGEEKRHGEILYTHSTNAVGRGGSGQEG